MAQRGMSLEEMKQFVRNHFEEFARTSTSAMRTSLPSSSTTSRPEGAKQYVGGA